MTGEIPLIGTDVLLKVYMNGEYTTVFGQRGCTLNLKMTTVAVNWKGSNRWTNRVPGDRDWSMDLTGMHWLEQDNTTWEPTIAFLRNTFMDDTPANNRLKVEMLFPGGYAAFGYGYMETMTLDEPVGTEATLKGTFTADGALAFA
jgi:predicted secreted protein